MSNLPWPDKYKKLFIDDGEYYEFSHIGWGPLDTQIGGYCIGYKLAADTLVKDALGSRNIYRLDTLVFPIIFLYRQYLELTLKSLIISLNSWSEEEKIKKFSKYNHDLNKLWVEFEGLYRKVVGEEIDEPFVVVKKYIQEFICIDRGSFSFRYPFTKELKLIFGNEDKINLAHFLERMEEIANFLSGAGDYMYDLKNV